MPARYPSSFRKIVVVSACTDGRRAPNLREDAMVSTAWCCQERIIPCFVRGCHKTPYRSGPVQWLLNNVLVSISRGLQNIRVCPVADQISPRLAGTYASKQSCRKQQYLFAEACRCSWEFLCWWWKKLELLRGDLCHQHARSVWVDINSKLSHIS